MFNKIIKIIKKSYKGKIKKREISLKIEERIDYLKSGMIPWSKGYHAYKTEVITRSINDGDLIKSLINNEIPENFGYRLDERVIEYPWIFSKLSKKNEKILDAGSTFNFDFIVNHDNIKSKDLTIFTYAPEDSAFNKKRVSYVYGDLRDLPFKNDLFDLVVSQSTIEHIDMDNSLYGYEIKHNEDSNNKSYEYLKALKEMIRVLKSKGQLLLTFPFGKFENHGFFQQFDQEMLDRILDLLKEKGNHKVTFFKYEKEGWKFAPIESLLYSESFNPHTGKGKKDDFAAHSRAVACIEFKKE
jgi:SAM-dependent methyltransferase